MNTVLKGELSGIKGEEETYYQKEVTRDIYNRLNLDVCYISPELYTFIVYDYFTSCFNVLYPANNELIRAVDIFEPIFLLIYSRYRNINDLLTLDDKFQDSIVSVSDDLMPSDDYIIKLKDYFGRFTIYRDDDFALKGWWRIDTD